MQRVGEHHPAFGIGMDYFDGRAVGRGNEVAGLVAGRANEVLGNREPTLYRVGHAEPAAGEERAERDGAALHVSVHSLHRFERLQIDAAGIEADTLADERQVRRMISLPLEHSATLRSRRRPNREATARNAPAFSRRNLERSKYSNSQPSALGQVGDDRFVGFGVELVGRQRGKPAGEVCPR